ncbi:MAG: TylF/MycF/NovP-related O-methyltransferase [Actinomycetota bacterium]
MTIKRKLESILRNCPPLFRLGSRVYHAINPGFKSLSPGAPDAIKHAFELAKNLHDGGPIGDYYEFGLYKGYTFFSAYRAAKRLGLTETRFYGFDSFQGLPQVEDLDKTGGRFFEGQFACTRQQVEKNLRKHGVDFNRIRLIEGFYEDTLVEHLKDDLPAGRAGVVLFDCDLYSSTRTALNWLEGLIADKTVVVFDDWYSFTEGDELGQQRALKEYQQRNKHLRFEPVMEYERNGKVFLVRDQEQV